MPRQFAEHLGGRDNIKLFNLKNNLRTRQPAIVTKRGQYISEYTECAIKHLTEKSK